MSAETFPAAPGAVSAGDFSPWSASSRIGRARLLAYSLVLQLAAMVAALPLTVLGGAGGLLIIVVLFGACIANIALMVRRSHDLDLSGWWTIVAVLVPFAVLYWVFRAGTAGPNRYGVPPPPNTTGVLVLAWVLPLFFVVGVLAAIALPAYRDYTVKAKVADVVISLADCRERIVAAYREGRAGPGAWGCREGGEAGRHARALEVDANGVIAVVLRDTGLPALDGRRLLLAPVDAAGATPNRVSTATIVGFRCESGGGLEARHLPGSCRR